jgi:hypothetical protein
MRTHVYKTMTLGELVEAVFDETAEWNTDPLEVSRLATQAVVTLLLRARRGSFSRSPLFRKEFDQEQCTRRIK